MALATAATSTPAVEMDLRHWLPGITSSRLMAYVAREPIGAEQTTVQEGPVKAAFYDRYGSPDEIHVEGIPAPTPGGGQDALATMPAGLTLKQTGPGWRGGGLVISGVGGSA